MDFDGRGATYATAKLGSTSAIDCAPSASGAANIFRRIADALDSGAQEVGFLFSRDEQANRRTSTDHSDLSYLVAWARKALKIRDQRAKFFPATDIFGEPCWDMILDLFIAKATGKSISVTSACVAARVPATTALRWLTVLERADIVARHADANDGRRFHVSLTERGFEATKSLIISSME